MRYLPLILLLTLAGASPLSAQGESGGLLFAYRPHPAARSDFEAGYRRHLDWHRERADSLAWFGWDVLVGPGLGLFVDGAFGMPFAALDQRVDPAGDRADAAVTFDPYGDAVSRELVVLRSDLSTATPLEDLTPTPFVQVVRYPVGEGNAAVLEAALRRLAERSAEESLQPYTVYESLAGSRTSFLLMIWRQGWAGFAELDRNPARRLRTMLASGAAAAVGEVTNEIWRYRSDLAYLGRTERER